MPRAQRLLCLLFAAAFVAARALLPPAPVAAGPVEPHQPPPGALVRLDLSAVPATSARALASALPEWSEAIAAGSARVTVERWQVETLRRSGFPVREIGPAPAVPSSWPACYDTIDEAYRWLADYATAHPELVTVQDAGDSYCKAAGGCRTPGGERINGRDILVARVTAGQAAAAKSGRMWIDGGLHARELPGTALMAAAIARMVEGYGTDAQITYLLDHRELYVGLNTNPDGRALVELGAHPPYGDAPWYWRKNAHPGGQCAWPPTGTDHFGVDLNRNHDFKWDAPGSTTDPCGETYRGRRAASEPETAAYEDFVRGLFPDRRGPADGDRAAADTMGILVNYHNATVPGTVLVPWGWTEDRPADDQGLTAIADRYVAGTDYERRYALYEVSGNTRDWGYGELGVPSFVVELEGDTFFTPCPALPKVIADQWPGLTALLGLADRPYERVGGPEVVALDAADTVRAGQPLTVTARLDESRAGGDRVAGAEITVALIGGAPDAAGHPAPGAPEGTGLPMAAADGRFDQAIEAAAGQVDTAGLRPGRHYVVVRARDAAGHWGPGLARFVDVLPPPTATATPTATASPTATPSRTPTPSATPSRTPTPSATVTSARTATATPTVTPGASAPATTTVPPSPAPQRLFVPIALQPWSPGVG